MSLKTGMFRRFGGWDFALCRSVPGNEGEATMQEGKGKGSAAGLLAGLLVGCVGLLFAYAGDAAAQLSKDEAKCINAMNKNLAKVASTMGKDVSACIKNFG
ncbi:MAG: hypothetical protein ACYS0K_24710, partial [Planctomycetota bacterium]